MVVFENGDAKKSEYKRFKIRSEVKGKPNDVAAISEIINRRLKHSDWKFPDLIIVMAAKDKSLLPAMRFKEQIKYSGNWSCQKRRNDCYVRFKRDKSFTKQSGTLFNYEDT